MRPAHVIHAHAPRVRLLRCSSLSPLAPQVKTLIRLIKRRGGVWTGGIGTGLDLGTLMPPGAARHTHTDTQTHTVRRARTRLTAFLCLCSRPASSLCTYACASCVRRHAAADEASTAYRGLDVRARCLLFGMRARCWPTCKYCLLDFTPAWPACTASRCCMSMHAQCACTLNNVLAC
jgi:hypothetical protein